MIDFIQNLCWPSLIYLIISLFGLLYSNHNTFGNIIHIIVIILMSYLLDRVCKTYGQTTSWYVIIILYVGLPIIFAIIIAILMMLMSSSNVSISNVTKSFSKSFSQSLKTTELFTPSKLTTKLTKLVSSKM
jgi:hypothetical protein